jgi:hypothetical protein
MTAAALHPAPGWRVVAAEQIRATGLVLRKGAALMVVMLLLLCAGAIRMATIGHAQHRPVNFAYTPEAALVFVVIAALIPFGIWQDEDPTRRTYHWSMPVSRHTHTLLKVFAGWTWTMALTAGLLGCIVGVTIIVERVTGDPQGYAPSFAPWVWLTPVAAATIAYALVSAAVVGSRRPFIWIIGIPAIYGGTLMLLSTMHLTDALASASSLWFGHVGAGAALGGQIADMTGNGGAGALSLHRWLSAVVVWGAIAGGLLVATSRRRGDR